MLFAAMGKAEPLKGDRTQTDRWALPNALSPSFTADKNAFLICHHVKLWKKAFLLEEQYIFGHLQKVIKDNVSWSTLTLVYIQCSSH